MEEKKKWKVNIWQILTCVLLAICILQNIVIKDQMNDMNTNLQNRISELRYDMDNISTNVSNTLEKEASMISFSDYSIENANIDAMTVDLVCELLPKEYSEENTKVSLVYAGSEYPMEFKDGSYKGVIPISVFEDAHIESAIMRDGDISRTESLSWYVSPRYDYLPIVYADFGNSSSWQKGDGGIIWTITGDVNTWMDQKGSGSTPDETYFCVMLNDELIERTDVSDQPTFTMDEKYEIPYGSTMTLYMEVVDEFGLYHRPILERVTATEDGNLIYDEDEWIWRGAAGNIYDENGELLYSEYEEYGF